MSQETPLPLYLAMTIHAETRKRDLIEKPFHLGLCMSYDRLLQVLASLANQVCDRYDVVSGVHPRHYAKGYSPLVPLIPLTTTPHLQPLLIRFMEQAYHLFNMLVLMM
jgi:hypothetical protein